MRIVFNFLKMPFLSVLIIAALEYGIIQITGDDQSCFFHNNVIGNILLWISRMVLFSFLTILLHQKFLPKYSSLKDRLLDKEELEKKGKQAQDRFWQEQGKKAVKQLG